MEAFIEQQDLVAVPASAWRAAWQATTPAAIATLHAQYPNYAPYDLPRQPGAIELTWPGKLLAISLAALAAYYIIRRMAS
jgi:hypothetical protein